MPIESSFLKLAILLLLVCGTLSAQEELNFQFDRIDKNNGLSNNNVTAICKDHLGFVWVGTSYGLCRIETQDRVKVFLMSEDNSLQSNNIRALHSDRQGNLWIGTRLGGLTRFNQKTGIWKTFLPEEGNSNSISHNEILSILEDHEGRIWVGTENGLNLYDAQDENFHRYLPDLSKADALHGKAILCITEDNEKRIWVGTWGGGMYLMLPSNTGDPKAATFRKFRQNPEMNFANNIWQIFQDHQDRFWVGSFGNGLFLMDLPQEATDNPEQQQWKPIFHNFKDNSIGTNPISQNAILDVIQDDTGVLWIATGNGLNQISIDQLEHLDVQLKAPKTRPDLDFITHFSEIENHRSMPSNSTTCLQLDNQGIVWIGTQTGLGRYNPNVSKFESHEIFSDQSNNLNSQSIYVDLQNRAWMGLLGDGIIRYDLETKKTDKLDGLKNNRNKSERSLSIYSKNDKDLYVATEDGFEIVNMDDLSMERFQLSKETYPSLEDYYVSNLLVDSKDRVWIATDQGLLVFFPELNKFNFFKHNDKLSSTISDNSVTQIFEASDGNIWVSTFNGLNKVKSIVDGEIEFIQFKQKRNDDGSSVVSNQISSICEVNEKLYLGMGSGISSYDLNMRKFKLEFENFEQFFYTGLASFDNNSIWATTTEGLVKISLKEKQLSTFGRAEGLKNHGFLTRCIIPGRNDKIYFGLSTGILGFHPDDIEQNETIPPVYITEIKVLNKDGEKIFTGIEQENMELGSDDYFVSFDFAALNFNCAEKNKYAYRLEGFEENWIHTSSDNTTATYTNLDPGRYVFHVKASNNDGVWNEIGASIKVEVSPALHETMGFRFCALVSLILSVLFGVKMYNRQLHLRNNAMEGMVKERTKELAVKNNQVKDLLEQIKQRNIELEQKVASRTERLKESNADLVRSNKDLEQFAYIASHDLQEPLRTIGSFASLLGRKYRGKLDTGAYEYLDYIVDGVGRMSNQIKSILTYSKVGKKELELSKTNLNSVIDLKLFDLSQKISERNAKVEHANLPEICCEKEHIGMLFYNLVNNGIKFNKKENPTVKIVHHVEGPEDYWKFSVTDDGIGIAPEYQDKIFEIFRRLHLKSEYKGTGIGLALCQKIVNRHGGKIWVESELGKGTTFFFTIRKVDLADSKQSTEMEVAQKA